MNIPGTMHAMVLIQPKTKLVYTTLPVPEPGIGQVLIKVIACGICRTDLHVIDGELANPKLPLVPGHEIIGVVVKKGESVNCLMEGDIVGVPWLGYTCGACSYCKKGQENLCDHAGFTGYTIDGGYAEYTAANAQYCFPMNKMYANPSGAPLLCAGLIGYRSYSMLATTAKNIGLYGFGAAAHILAQVAVYEHKNVFAFTSKGDTAAQQFAITLGAAWAGDATENPPVQLDAAIIFAPVGALVPKALQDVCKGGEVICGGIHMSDIPSFPYDILWGERVVRSVANLTRNDGEQFLKIAPQVPVKTHVQLFKLAEANQALDALRNGNVQGAAVLTFD